jgi:hypothetical protein
MRVAHLQFTIIYPNIGLFIPSFSDTLGANDTLFSNSNINDYGTVLPILSTLTFQVDHARGRDTMGPFPPN